MRKFPVTCPRCRQKTGAQILYGLPILEEIEEELNRGAVVLGGCAHPLDGADRQCTHCGYSWIANRKQWQWTGEHWPLPDYFRFEVTTPEKRQWLNWRDSKVVIGKDDARKPERLDVDKTLLCYTMFQLDMDLIDIWSWSRNGKSFETVSGDLQWSLELVRGARRMKSCGIDVFPNHVAPDSPDSESFVALLWSCWQLTSGKVFGDFLTTDHAQ